MRARLLTLCLVIVLAVSCGEAPLTTDATPARPNVVWIVADDVSLEIGAYGDALARTPNLDALAGAGVRYTNTFATSGVCAPSRAALITGMFATSIGAQHMRSLDRGYQPVPPPAVRTFTEYLRAAGYYTSSLGKLDYQFSGVGNGAPITNWDQPNGDWRGRAAGQPFFAYFTLLTTHESMLFGDTSNTTTDPARVSVPPYYPDTPLVRQDFARHYDNVARMDQQVGDILAMLEADGVAGETIVFFFADNGRGMPRDKRWVYDGGIHMPLIIRWPNQLTPGSVDDQLVSYVDFAPTVLALAGVAVPPHLPGRAFLGRNAEPEPDYVFAAADRHDEAEDRIRAVRDTRFKYIRNYRPDTPYGQTVRFRNNLATMKEIFRLHDAGTLTAPADWYYVSTKPIEELYDIRADPHELVNLAGAEAYRAVLERMRRAHERWVEDTGDLGAIAEADLAERYWPGGIQPRTPPPQFAPAAGLFSAPLAVSLTSSEPGVSIAYTLDDDAEPAPRWLLYDGPITLHATTTVRARAIRYGWAESAETRVTYHIARPSLMTATSAARAR